MSKGPKNVQPSTAQSQFSGVNNYNIGLDGFGNTSSQKSGDSLNTNTTLDQSIKPTYNNATAGLASNTGYLAQNPQQQIDALQQGQNPYYNALKAQNDLNYQTQLSQLQSRFSNNGLENSTALGGFLGQNALNANLADSQNQVSALTTQNQLANNNVAGLGNVLNSIYGYEGNQNQQAQQGLLNSLTAQDANAQFNAGQIQNANQYNSQAGAARGGILGSSLGSAIGAGLSLAAAPFTGGSSLTLLPALAGAGGAIGSGGQSQAPQLQNTQGLLGNYYNPISPFQQIPQYNQLPFQQSGYGGGYNAAGSGNYVGNFIGG